MASVPFTRWQRASHLLSRTLRRMHRTQLHAWLSKLDDDLAAGLGRDRLYVEHVRELLRTTVVPESRMDLNWLHLALGDLERHHGVRLRKE